VSSRTGYSYRPYAIANSVESLVSRRILDLVVYGQAGMVSLCGTRQGDDSSRSGCLAVTAVSGVGGRSAATPILDYFVEPHPIEKLGCPTARCSEVLLLAAIPTNYYFLHSHLDPLNIPLRSPHLKATPTVQTD
jgi:hypothetical protein